MGRTAIPPLHSCCRRLRRRRASVSLLTVAAAVIDNCGTCAYGATTRRVRIEELREWLAREVGFATSGAGVKRSRRRPPLVPGDLSGERSWRPVARQAAITK